MLEAMIDGKDLEIVLRFTEIISIIGGGGLVLFKLGKTAERFEGTVTAQTKELTELKEDVKSLNVLMKEVAVQDQQIENVTSRLERLEKWWDELRHGEGFVFPLDRPKAR